MGGRSAPRLTSSLTRTLDAAALRNRHAESPSNSICGRRARGPTSTTRVPVVDGQVERRHEQPKLVAVVVFFRQFQTESRELLYKITGSPLNLRGGASCARRRRSECWSRSTREPHSRPWEVGAPAEYSCNVIIGAPGKRLTSLRWRRLPVKNPHSASSRVFAFMQ